MTPLIPDSHACARKLGCSMMRLAPVVVRSTIYPGHTYPIPGMYLCPVCNDRVSVDPATEAKALAGVRGF